MDDLEEALPDDDAVSILLDLPVFMEIIVILSILNLSLWNVKLEIIYILLYSTILSFVKAILYFSVRIQGHKSKN